jgi:hypothetical protein
MEVPVKRPYGSLFMGGTGLALVIAAVVADFSPDTPSDATIGFTVIGAALTACWLTIEFATFTTDVW